MKILLDNNLPPPLARALHALSEKDGHMVVHLRERFSPETPDPEWIRALGAEREWVVLSGDLRISRNPAERSAWLESGLVMFFLAKGWSGFTVWDKAWRLVRWWPQILGQAAKVRAPAGFIVPVSGSKFEVVSTQRSGAE